VGKTEGTFPFYSPEMCKENASVYSAYMSDVWAASVCLWIFIFGKLPFYHPDVVKLFTMIRCEDPVMPHRVSPELENLLGFLLQKNVHRRLSVAHIQHHPWLTGRFLNSVKRNLESQKSEKSVDTAHKSVDTAHKSVDKSVDTSNNSCDETIITMLTATIPVGPNQIEENIRQRIPPALMPRIVAWKESAKATCEARKSKLLRTSTSDISTLVRKSYTALKGRLPSETSMDGNINDTFTFSDDNHDGDSIGSDDSDPLARLVSYDEISAHTLQQIEEHEKMKLKSKIMESLDDDDGESSTSGIPNRGLTPPRHKRTASLDSNTTNITPSESGTPTSVKKKALRSGRKKMIITSTGEVKPIIAMDTSTEERTSSSKSRNSFTTSSIEVLDKIMKELEQSEEGCAYTGVATSELKTDVKTKKERASIWDVAFCCCGGSATED